MKKWIFICFAIATCTVNAKNMQIDGENATGRLFSLSWSGNNLSINTTKPGKYYQFAGIKSVTSGFSFSNCTPNENGYCIFSASDTITASPILAGPAIQPALTLCLDGEGDTYSCERNQLATRFAYVSNFGNATVLLCPINSNGTFGACGSSGNTGTAFSQPYQIAINNAGTIAYVVSRTGAQANKVFVCPINSNGIFGNCVNSGNSGLPFNQPSGIVLNGLETLAYVTNQLPGNFVSICPINTDGLFGACRDSGNTGIPFSRPNGIVLNSTGTIAYVANINNSTVSKCPINTDGNFGSCTDSGNTGVVFNQPDGLALNSAGTIAYVANIEGDTVSKCPINAGGSFGACVDSGAGIVFNGPFGIALNSTGTFAYVANSLTGNNTVSKCPINADGSFGACVSSGNSGTAFNRPIWITLF